MQSLSFLTRGRCRQNCWLLPFTSITPFVAGGIARLSKLLAPSCADSLRCTGCCASRLRRGPNTLRYSSMNRSQCRLVGQRAGFTLVELLVVIAIIGILIGLLM